MAAGTNVMPLARGPAQSGKGRQISGDGRAASARTAGRGHAASQKNGKFGDVLEQTQDISESTKGSMGAVDEAVNLPKDPIAAAIAATSQPKQQDNASASEEHDTAEQPGQAEASDVKAANAQSVRPQVETGMAGVVLEIPTENEVPSANLQTILPQSDEAFQKGKSMLDILSGRGWKQTGGQGSNQAVGAAEAGEAALNAAGLPNSQMPGGTRFMGEFQVQTGNALNNQNLDASQAKTMNMPQVMWTAQDAKGISDQQIQQLPPNEDPQRTQQGTQANRPQAQPGMQGMPVMQDAQASLTRFMQNGNVQQNLHSLERPMSTGDAIRPIMERNPEAVSNMLKGSAEMIGSVQPEQENVSGTQGFAIPQDRIQQIDRRQSAFNFKPVEKSIPQVEDVPETGLTSTEKTVEQAPAAASIVKGRQEPRLESTDFTGTGNGEKVEAEQTTGSFRKMMHGQEQMGDGRQQPEERRQMTGQQATVPQENVEGHEANRSSTRQQVSGTVQQETVSQPNPQHQQPIGFQQTLNTAQAQASEGTQPPMASAQEFDIPGQIVEQARLIRSSGNTEMVMHLKPEHLGDLTLRVSVSEHGAVTASFHSDNAQVRAIIEHSLVQLKQELSNQGIKVDNVEVYAGLSDDGLLNGQSQQAWQQNQQNGSRRNRSFDMEAFEEESGELSADPGYESAEEGVDYRV